MKTIIIIMLIMIRKNLFAILLDYADESNQDFDELLIEPRSASPLGSSKNRYGAIWLHFAVRPKGNRRKVAFINA